MTRTPSKPLTVRTLVRRIDALVNGLYEGAAVYKDDLARYRRALTALLATESAAAEREAVVRWLRDWRDNGGPEEDDTGRVLDVAIFGIERGDHRRAP